MKEDFINDLIAEETKQLHEERGKIIALMNKLYTNSLSSDDTLILLNDYIARDFKFFGVRSDRDYLKLKEKLIKGEKEFSSDEKSKLNGYLMHDLNTVNNKLSLSSADGYLTAEEIKEIHDKIEADAQKTAKPEHKPDERLHEDVKQLQIDVEENDKSIFYLYRYLNYLKRQYAKTLNNNFLVFIDLMQREIDKKISEKNELDKGNADDRDKVISIPRKDQEEKHNGVIASPEQLSSLEEKLSRDNNDYEYEKRKEEAMNNIDIINHVNEEPKEEKRLDSSLDDKKDKYDYNYYGINIQGLSSDPDKQEEMKGYINDILDFKSKMDPNYYLDVLDEKLDQEHNKKTEGVEYSFLDDLQNKLDKMPLENQDFEEKLKEAIDAIDSGIDFKGQKEERKEEPSTEKPVITKIEDAKDLVEKEAEVIFDNPVTMHTISDEVYTHEEVLNTIDDIYKTNHLYEEQIKKLGKDRLSISLKRDMLKETKKNLKTLELMKQFDSIYSKVLILTEKLKIYEGLPYSRENKKKIKYFRKEIDKLCGKNNEYFPLYFIDEINKKLNRTPKSLKIIKKEAMNKRVKKRPLIAAGLAGLLAVNAFGIGYTLGHRKEIKENMDEVSNPIEVLMNIGKKIARNGINGDIRKILNNEKVDDAINTFADSKELFTSLKKK